jgi:spermidine synthase
MIKSFNRLLVATWLGTWLTPVVILFSMRSRHDAGASNWAGDVLIVALATIAGIGTKMFQRALNRFAPRLEELATGQVAFLNGLAPKYVNAAILASAALSLFLELSVIRWQGTVFEFFAFYKNFGLLTCFAGLGLGYALAGRGSIPLILTIPMMAWQFVFMIVLRFADGGWALSSINAIPLREQLNMGAGNAPSLAQGIAIYFLLAVVFLLTALMFIPVGQLCGCLMQRKASIRAYGMNLLGSLAGVVLTLAVSFLWTPPVVWFSLCLLCILFFVVRTPFSLVTSATFAILCVVILSWPVSPQWQRIYSPYQILELGPESTTGLTLVRAAGQYYQRIWDLSPERTEKKFQSLRDYYEFPYKANTTVKDVAIVGAGTGNDVASALRSGVSRVDAIEIDPAILATGQARHPEKPYSDPRVHAMLNDARSFLRTTNNRYDMIVYGLLDSHTLLSQAASVRLDSFVYTVEGLREARARLKAGGVLSLSFCVLSPELGRKIYLMLQAVFDGRPPHCVRALNDNAVIFMESNDPGWSIPPTLIAQSNFTDVTAEYADPKLTADVSTDNWPFFYMPRRIYPVSYLWMIAQILLLSVWLTGNFFSQKPQFNHMPYFFLGVAFMLVETKAVTEMGLTFGNTWQIIGLVIASILVMAFLANAVVDRFKIRRPYLAYLILCGCLLLGWAVARSGGLPSTTMGRLGAAILLTSPLFFSGIVFSSLLQSDKGLHGAMAMNILGALCGGLLEYNSMYFGFQSLYLMAIGCYVLAFVSGFWKGRPATAGAAAAVVEVSA